MQFASRMSIFPARQSNAFVMGAPYDALPDKEAAPAHQQLSHIDFAIIITSLFAFKRQRSLMKSERAEKMRWIIVNFYFFSPVSRLFCFISRTRAANFTAGDRSRSAERFSKALGNKGGENGMHVKL